jgi:hypothetical protein
MQVYFSDMDKERNMEALKLHVPAAKSPFCLLMDTWRPLKLQGRQGPRMEGAKRLPYKLLHENRVGKENRIMPGRRREET